MRISDWSSDVCASDLQGLDDRKNVFGAQRRHIVRAVQLQPHVHLDAADGRQVIAFWIEQQPREQRLGGLARRRFARAHQAIDVAERLVRSEEHTSELQSIMRNSYADFCLKKKKHNTP